MFLALDQGSPGGEVEVEDPLAVLEVVLGLVAFPALGRGQDVGLDPGLEAVRPDLRLVVVVAEDEAVVEVNRPA